MPRKPPTAATALPRATVDRPRLVPDPKQKRLYSPADDRDAVLGLLLGRHPHTTEVQWSVTCTWNSTMPVIWRAEAWHPSTKITPYAASGETARDAMTALAVAIRRGHA